MTDSMWWVLILTVGLLALGAFFSTLESAVTFVSRARVAEMAAEDRRGAKLVSTMLSVRPRYISMLLLLKTICETLATVFVVWFFLRVYDGHPNDNRLALITTSVTMIIVLFVLVSVGPETLGRQHAYTLTLSSAWLLYGLGRLFGPIPRFLVLVSNAITPGRGYRNGPFASETELMEIVDMAESRGVVESEERDMIRNIIDLGDTSAREVMVPRTEMVWIEADKTADHAMELAVKSGHSRIPVVGENVDDIVGIFYLKDEVARVYEQKIPSSSVTVESVMRKPVFLPDSKVLDDLLNEMQLESFHLAILVDEYGGVAGIVTIEDILEEIVGEISDEYDYNEIAPIEVIDKDTWRVSARLSLDDFEELTGKTFDEDVHEEVDTVGGLMAYIMGRVPLAGDTIETHGLGVCAGATRDHRGRLVLTTMVVHLLDPAYQDDELDREEK